MEGEQLMECSSEVVNAILSPVTMDIVCSCEEVRGRGEGWEEWGEGGRGREEGTVGVSSDMEVGVRWLQLMDTVPGLFIEFSSTPFAHDQGGDGGGRDAEMGGRNRGRRGGETEGCTATHYRAN